MLLASAVIIVATFLTGFVHRAALPIAESATTSGDCNGSGSIDSADVTAATSYLFANDGSQPAGCNANGDGVFDSADVVCIQRMAAGATSCEPANLNARLGTNLNAVVDFSPEYTFINAFKASREWISREYWYKPNVGGWGENKAELIPLDADGYPTGFIPAAECDNPAGCWIASFLFKDIGGNYPAGTYEVRFDGEGTLIFSGDASPSVTIHGTAASGGSGSFVVNSPSNNGVEINLFKTDPNGTGDYIRNIRIIMPGYAPGDEETIIFHSDFLDSIAPMKTLRFMDWMRTNFSTQGNRDAITSTVTLVDEDVSLEPYATLINGHVVNTSGAENSRAISARIPLEYAQYSTDKGVPAEIMVELANTANIDPWFNMPHLATDAYVTDFATTVRDNLEPTQRVYVEYSNEIWNTIFSQSFWITDQGKAKWEGVDVIDQAKQLNWYGMRSHEVCKIWDQVFAAEKDRVICVLNAQASNTGASWILQQMLDCPLWSEGPCSAHIDAVAIAPYIGNYLANQNPLVQGWLNDGGTSGALDTLFTEIITGGIVQTPGALVRSIGDMNNYADLVATRNLDLISYEGGQHLHSNSYNVNQLFLAASNDPRMKDVYDGYLAAWPGAGTSGNAGGELFLHFNNTSKYGASGAWGSQEMYNDTTRPKLDALLDYNAAAPCHWADCEGLGTSVSAELTLPAISAVNGSNTLPISLTTKGYDVSSLSFALNYDADYLTYQSVALVAGLSAEFDLTVTDSGGLLQITVYPKDGTPVSLPDGTVLNLVFDAARSTGDGVGFVAPQVGGGSAMQPITCGDDFGRTVNCTGTGTTLQIAPSAITLQQSNSATTERNLLPAVLLMTLVTAAMLHRRRNWQA